MRTYYVKALTLETAIVYYTNKGNLYKKNKKFNNITVSSICKCAGYRYASVCDSYIYHDDIRYSLNETGDVKTDITMIWNIAKTILENIEMKKSAKKYNL